jgi:hypothetical protein
MLRSLHASQAGARTALDQLAGDLENRLGLFVVDVNSEIGIKLPQLEASRRSSHKLHDQHTLGGILKPG